MQAALLEVEDDSNILLNISSQSDPEVSDLGSKDSVATSYKMMGSSRSFLQSAKVFMAWILTGAAGKIILTVFVGLFGARGLYLLYKLIRNGI